MGLHIFLFIVFLPILHEQEYFAYRRRFSSIFSCIFHCGPRKNSLQQIVETNAVAMNLNQLDGYVPEKSQVDAIGISDNTINQSSDQMQDKLPVLIFAVIISKICYLLYLIDQN